MAASVESGIEGERPQMSLDIAAARNLATTTKSVPQMQAITSRWLLRILPWVQVSGGTYRVNRRLSYAVGDGWLDFIKTGAEYRVIPKELCELPLLRGCEDDEVLKALADRFVQKEFEPGAVIVEKGKPADHVFLIAHGKANKIGVGEFDGETVLDVLADGDYFGDRALVEAQDTWDFTVKAVTRCTVLSLPQQVLEELINQSEVLRAHVEKFKASLQQPQNEYGEADVALKSGHAGEPELPGTFVDYEVSPREYPLSVAQTVLRVHTRVADLYNDPMNQIEQQLRLTIEALRERQENDMINNRDIGLLHNADTKYSIHARTGHPPLTISTNCWPWCGRSRGISWPTPAPLPPLVGSATVAASTRKPSTCRATWCPPGAASLSFPATRSPSLRPTPAPSSCSAPAKKNKASSACIKSASPMNTSPA
jgi:CRP-like cAMP-binding protein